MSVKPNAFPSMLFQADSLIDEEAIEIGAFGSCQGQGGKHDVHEMC